MGPDRSVLVLGGKCHTETLHPGTWTHLLGSTLGVELTSCTLHSPKGSLEPGT